MGGLSREAFKISKFCYNHFNSSQIGYVASFACLRSKRNSPSCAFSLSRKGIHTIHTLHYKNKIDSEVPLSMVPRKKRSTDQREINQSYIESWSWVEAVSRNFGKDTKIEWEEIIKKAITADPLRVSEANFGGMLLVACQRYNGFEVAKAYLEWIKTPSVIHLASFMRICGDNMDKVSEEYILGLYNKIKARNKGIWEFNLAEKVTYTLSKTTLWKETVDIMEAVRLSVGGSLRTKSNIISAAFINNEFDLGWSILNKSAYEQFPRSVFSDWLRLCPKTQENFDKLIDFCDVFEVHPTEALMADVSSYLETNFNYSEGKTTRINPKTGVCANCKQALSRSDLTAAEFKSLQDSFLQHVIVREDVFFNTSPQELEDYQKFISRNGPFDYVLDALNIAHLRETPGGRRSYGRLVAGVVSNFASEGKRVLIIGRRHISEWPKSILRSLSEHGYLYLIDDRSEADPFIIYAALKSGPNAMYISRGVMRGLMNRLQNAQIARLFKRWRFAHQLSPEWDCLSNNFNLLLFTPVLPVPQKNAHTGIWHIPYDTGVIASPYELPSNWMCLTPKK